MREGKDRRICRRIWDEEEREVFKEELGEVEVVEGGVQEIIGGMGVRIK